MNPPAPRHAPSRDTTADRKAARRNYVMFCGASGLFLLAVVLVGSLFVMD